MSEDFTKMSTCLLCDTKIDAKSGIQICSTCAIIAMPDEDFQKLYYISLLENWLRLLTKRLTTKIGSLKSSGMELEQFCSSKKKKLESNQEMVMT
jgi:hypothetical protein